MARKTKIVSITADNRDHGKQFLVTEMPAAQAERWANRALTALGKSDPNIPDDFKLTGMSGLASIGARTIFAMPWEDMETLLSEMMGCVQIIPDTARPAVVRPLVESDIEEVPTIYLLRSEVIEIHTGFSIAAKLSEVGAAFKADLISKPTPTSPSPSGLQ